MFFKSSIMRHPKGARRCSDGINCELEHTSMGTFQVKVQTRQHDRLWPPFPMRQSKNEHGTYQAPLLVDAAGDR